jgi:hypothetical protein
MGRCFGRTANWQRCARICKEHLFCSQHRKQPFILLFVLIFTVGGGIASIKSAFWPANANFNWPEVFQELERREHQNQQQPLLTRTFWLLKEPGASISLGPCPGAKCLTFRLGELETNQDILIQRIYVQGGGFQIKSRAAGTSKYDFQMDNMMIVRGSGFTIPLDGTDPWISLTLQKDANFRMFLKNVADIELKVLDTKTDSLRLQLEVSPPTNKTLGPNSDKPVP